MSFLCFEEREGGDTCGVLESSDLLFLVSLSPDGLHFLLLALESAVHELVEGFDGEGVFEFRNSWYLQGGFCDVLHKEDAFLAGVDAMCFLC